jgi:hypothetical protein
MILPVIVCLIFVSERIVGSAVGIEEVCGIGVT